MKKIVICLFLSLLLCSVLIISGCDKLAAISNMMTPEEARAKLGNFSITYKMEDGEGGFDNITFMQDGSNYMMKSDVDCIIFNATQKKLFYIDIADKEYTETILTDDQISADSNINLYTSVLFSSYVYALLLTESGSAKVAGRDCTKYTYDFTSTNEGKGIYYVDKEFGILMKIEEEGASGTVVAMEVTDITNVGITTESFLADFPSGYTLVASIDPIDTTLNFSELAITVNNESNIFAGLYTAVYSVNNKAAYSIDGVTFAVSVKDGENNDITVNNEQFTAEAGKTYTVTVTASKTGETAKTASYTVTVLAEGAELLYDDLTIVVSNVTEIPEGDYTVSYSVQNKTAYIESGVNFIYSVRDKSDNIISSDINGKFTVAANEIYTVTIAASKEGEVTKTASYTVTAVILEEECKIYKSYSDYYGEMVLGSEIGLISNISIGTVYLEDVEEEDGALNAFSVFSDNLSLYTGIGMQAIEAVKQFEDGTFVTGDYQHITLDSGVYTVDFLYNNGSFNTYAYRAIISYDEATNSMRMEAYYPAVLNGNDTVYEDLEFILEYVRNDNNYTSWFFNIDEREQGQTITRTLIKLLGNHEAGIVAENRQFMYANLPILFENPSVPSDYISPSDDRIFTYAASSVIYDNNLICEEELSYNSMNAGLTLLNDSINTICDNNPENEDAYAVQSNMTYISDNLSFFSECIEWIELIEKKEFKGLTDGRTMTYTKNIDTYNFEISELYAESYTYTVKYDEEKDSFCFINNDLIGVEYTKQTDGSYAVQTILYNIGELSGGGEGMLYTIIQLLYDGVSGILSYSNDAEQAPASIYQNTELSLFPSGDSLYTIEAESINLCS